MTVKQKNNILGLLLLSLMTISGLSPSFAQRVGDAGVKFDMSKLDNRYPQMKEWMKAGVEGGIPLLSNSKIKKTIGPTNSEGINKAINEVSRSGGGQLRLRNGDYNINKTVFLKNNVRVVGESRKGVVLTINMTGKKDDDRHAIYFKGVKYAGLERLTLTGNQTGKPDPFKMANVKPNYFIRGVVFGSRSKNCWVDAVTILNTGGSPINTWKADHLTFRDLYVDGVWNKGGGGSGYFAIQSGHALVYNCTVKNLRHFAIQREGAYYNVIYKNDLQQDVNFHHADAGNNLVEQNKITIASGHDYQYHALMGPWASFHRVSDTDNYIYKNTCLEKNNRNRRSFSDNSKVYLGPRRKEERSRIPEYPFENTNKTPKYGTFYPVKANGNAGPSTGGDSGVRGDINGIFTIRSKASSENIISSEREGYGVRMYSSKTIYKDHKWEIKSVGDGKHTIKNISSGRYLEVPYGKCAKQSKIGTWTGAGADHQKWYIELVGSDYFLVPTHCTTMALDRNNAKGLEALLWNYRKSDNQKFELLPANNQKVSSLDISASSKPIDISVFPNPTHDELQLDLTGHEDESIVYTIMTTAGNIISNGAFGPEHAAAESIDVQNLELGMYIIYITPENHGDTVLKFFIDK